MNGCDVVFILNQRKLKLNSSNKLTEKNQYDISYLLVASLMIGLVIQWTNCDMQ